jgi:uroporphyrinogen decarboxylase
MNSRERVIAVIEQKKADRIPIYGWLKANLSDQISARFGSVEAFEDVYEFDLAHLFPSLSIYDADIEAYQKECGGSIEPLQLLDLPMTDPDDMRHYESLKEQIEHHKEKRSRFVYVQTPGIFECNNAYWGIENHMMYMMLFEKELCEVYKRQAEWNKRFALNCLDMGIDMIHVSDDWGAQDRLMFSPESWRKMIFPYHKITCDAVKRKGGYLSLHSDGNINSVLDGIVELGFDVVHPFQESAGMSFEKYLEKYGRSFAIMGGLDVQNAIGFGKLNFLESEIKRVLSMFKERGILYCTSHFVQDHCSMEELVFAYDLIYSCIRQ